MNHAGRLTVAALLAAVAGCANPPPSPVAPPTDATSRLAQLTVAEPTTTPPYSRVADFGRAWALDADHNGCRQRDDVLRRDMAGITPRGRCGVAAGTLTDPYTGHTIAYTATRPAAVQIDHVAPLGYVWRHGAAGWTRRQRLEFANDLANLLAVDGRQNEAKGDRGPAAWMPPDRSYWCAYATRYVDVAWAYHLSVTSADATALAGALRTCPSTPAGHHTGH